VASEAFAATATTGQGGQTIIAAASQVAAGNSGTATTGQGSQIIASTAAETFSAIATSIQGGQSTTVSAAETFSGTASSGQGSQSVLSAASEAFTGTATTAQGAQSINASDAALVPITGDAATAQGAQSILADAAQAEARVPGGSGGGRPTAHSRIVPMHPRTRAYGFAESEQDAGQTAGAGEIIQPAVTGRAETTQACAEIISFGEINNRIPNNRKKAAIAAALMLMAA
jgi:hypothetical protein